MRYDVKKFLFIGIEEEKPHFFSKAQDLGIINFIEVKGKAKELPSDIHNLMTAIKVLRGLPTIDQETLSTFSQADQLVTQILHDKNRLSKLEEEQRTTRLEIERVGIFGDFSKEDIAYIEQQGQTKVRFYFAKHGIAEHHVLPRDVLYIASDHNLDYFVAISPESIQDEHLIEMHIHQPLGELRNRYHEIWKEMHHTENHLKQYAKYNTFLHHALVHKLNQYNLQAAQSSVETQLNDSLFVVEGWVPVNKLNELTKLTEELNVYSEEIATSPSDVVPTYLENRGIPKVGEDIIHIYDTPSITDKDPSVWVLIFFAFFFAMIVGDGGYGLIFLGIALYIRYKYGVFKGTKKRFMQLFFILAASCIAWGVLTNSFFGITFAPDSPVRKVSLINWLVEKKAEYHLTKQDETYQHLIKEFPHLAEVKDSHEFVAKGIKIGKGGGTSYDIINEFTDGIMMELALLVGVIHIILSMLRYIGRNWVNVGWIAFIVGGYLYFPYYLKATSMLDFVFHIDRESLAKSGLYLMLGGISLATILSLIKNKVLGIFEPMVAIQVFSDILSYLRLYALGLASALVVATMHEAVAAVGIVFGAIILIVGNVINIALSIMGGVIHGLRLNFLEWFHYSFEGGGTLFKPLRKIPIEQGE